MKKTFAIVFLLALAVIGCGKKEASNAENAALAAELTESTMMAAKNLAAINPKHSEFYYREVLVGIIKDCLKEADPAGCVNSKASRLKYE